MPNSRHQIPSCGGGILAPVRGYLVAEERMLTYVEEAYGSGRGPGGGGGAGRRGCGRFLTVPRAAPVLRYLSHHAALSGVMAEVGLWRLRPRNRDVTCLECHVPTVEQQVHELVVYMQGDDEIPLPELQYPKEDCYDCHEHGTFDQIVEMTAELEETVGANPHASHDRELECRPCHKMHAESEDRCRACHQ